MFQQALLLYQRGRLADAETLCRDVLAQTPDDADTLHLLGLIETHKANFLAARACFDRAITLKPDYAEAYFNRGNVLQSLERREEALASYDKTISLKPDHAEAYCNRGPLLGALNRFEAALESCEKAIAIKPDLAVAYMNRGKALEALKRWEEAISSFDQAIALNSGYAEAFYNRGVALQSLKRYRHALDSYQRAVAIKPDFAVAYCNLGIVLEALMRRPEALASYDRAIALKPDLAEAYLNRGNALQALRRMEEALASFDKAIALRPGYPEGYFNRGHARLRVGRFREGWADRERRRTRAELMDPWLRQHSGWTGDQDLEGKTLFVHFPLQDRGFGETIQFCRYLKLAEAKGAGVIFSPQPGLKRLLKGLSPTLELVDWGARPRGFDYHIPLLSMPFAFKTEESSIPSTVPYLSAEPDRIVKWKAQLGEHGYKVGIAWQGSPSGAELRRDLPISAFRKIAALPSVRLISLQKKIREEDLQRLSKDLNVETLGEEFDAGPDAFLDTAAVMENLDLVITTDTSIAHLAGALARPTWVALKHLPDWRWLLDRSDSPWYPTTRLFRQRSHDEWSPVFDEMENVLRTLIAV